MLRCFAPASAPSMRPSSRASAARSPVTRSSSRSAFRTASERFMPSESVVTRSSNTASSASMTASRSLTLRAAPSALSFSMRIYASSIAKYVWDIARSSLASSSARSSRSTCFARNLMCGAISRLSASTCATLSSVFSSFRSASCLRNSNTLRPSASSSIARRSRGAAVRMRSASPWEMM